MTALGMCNILKTNLLDFAERCHLCIVRASQIRLFDVPNRVVLQDVLNVSYRYKYLIFSMLNSIYIIVDVIDYAYLCIAKVSYYGRPTYRHSTHGYASPVRDAAGTRGIIGKG